MEAEGVLGPSPLTLCQKKKKTFGGSDSDVLSPHMSLKLQLKRWGFKGLGYADALTKTVAL